MKRRITIRNTGLRKTKIIKVDKVDLSKWKPDVLPTESPEKTRPLSKHQLDIITEPVLSGSLATMDLVADVVSQAGHDDRDLLTP